MARLIDVDSAVKAISRLAEDMSINDRAVALLLALELNNEDRFPTADVAPVKHGHWERCNEIHVEFSDGFKGTMYDAKCSVCGKLQNPIVLHQYSPLQFDYCPRCGAKMNEVTE